MPALREGMRIRTCTTYVRSVSKEEESKCVGRDSKAFIRDRWWHVASSSSPRRRRRRRKGARKVSVYVARMMPSPSSGLSPLTPRPRRALNKLLAHSVPRIPTYCMLSAFGPSALTLKQRSRSLTIDCADGEGLALSTAGFNLFWQLGNALILFLLLRVVFPPFQQ